jgi:hypothetical protein
MGWLWRVSERGVSSRVRAMIHPLNPPRRRNMNGEKMNTPFFSDGLMLAMGVHNLCQTFLRGFGEEKCGKRTNRHPDVEISDCNLHQKISRECIPHEVRARK